MSQSSREGWGWAQKANTKRSVLVQGNTTTTTTNAGWWYVLATQSSLHPVLSCGLCTARRVLAQRNTTSCNKRGVVVRARHTEVTASRSELWSLHCPRHLLFLALLPACDGSQVIMRQDCSAYAAEPLRTAGLLEAAHQYSLQDM